MSVPSLEELFDHYKDKIDGVEVRITSNQSISQTFHDILMKAFSYKDEFIEKKKEDTGIESFDQDDVGQSIVGEILRHPDQVYTIHHQKGSVSDNEYQSITQAISMRGSRFILVLEEDDDQSTIEKDDNRDLLTKYALRNDAKVYSARFVEDSIA